MTTSSATPTPLPRKLGVTGETVFHVRHAPPGFAELLGDTEGGVWQASLLAPIDVVITFHTRLVPLRAEWARLTAAAEPTGVVWVVFPKATSDVDTDLTGDVLRAELLPTGWVDNKVCAVDDTWTGLRFAQRVERRRPKDNARKRR
jgi:hypothetical protein